MSKRIPVAGFNVNPQNINRNGRPPKGYSITSLFQEMMNNRPETKKAIANSILKKALEGDIQAQKLIWNYMDGLPPESIDLTSGGEKMTAIDINIIHGKIEDQRDDSLESQPGVS